MIHRWAVHGGAGGKVMQDAVEVGSNAANKGLDAERHCHDMLADL